jgi:SAM-dependent methyltransferase
VFRHTALVYDLIYAATGKDYARESEELHELVERRLPSARTLLDVACGTGGHLRHLQPYYDVRGLDLDEQMLEQARGHLPEVPLVQGDMRTFELGGRFDVVICLFSSVGYMRDVDELEAAVVTMARHLVPGGLLIIDGWVRPDAWRDGDSTHVDVAQDERVKVARVSRSVRDRRSTSIEMHHLIATAEKVDYVIDRHELTLFSSEEYQAAFERAGCRVDVVPSPMAGRDRFVGTAGVRRRSR